MYVLNPFLVTKHLRFLGKSWSRSCQKKNPASLTTLNFWGTSANFEDAHFKGQLDKNACEQQLTLCAFG